MATNVKVRVFFLCLLGLIPARAFARNMALSVYGGQLTEEKWERALSPNADYSGATIAVVAASWTFHEFLDGDLSCELEAQVGKYFGDQDHWEFNLPVIGLRWHRFPWNHHVETSFAWGIGPSYATNVPEVELKTNEDSNKWLVYWFGEFAFGPPGADWEVLTRLHHRSDAFGLVANDGGSTAVTAGLRYRF